MRTNIDCILIQKKLFEKKIRNNNTYKYQAISTRSMFFNIVKKNIFSILTNSVIFDSNWRYLINFIFKS